MDPPLRGGGKLKSLPYGVFYRSEYHTPETPFADSWSSEKSDAPSALLKNPPLRGGGKLKSLPYGG